MTRNERREEKGTKEKEWDRNTIGIEYGNVQRVEEKKEGGREVKTKENRKKRKERQRVKGRERQTQLELNISARAEEEEEKEMVKGKVGWGEEFSRHNRRMYVFRA